MTHKDRIFVHAIRDLHQLTLDDNDEITDVENIGTHSVRIRVRRKGSDPLTTGPRYFRLTVTEER